MRIEHDKKQDLLYIYLRDGEHEETFELADDVYVDVDENGNALGLEVLSSESLAKWLEGPVKQRLRISSRIRRD